MVTKNNVTEWVLLCLEITSAKELSTLFFNGTLGKKILRTKAENNYIVIPNITGMVSNLAANAVSF